MVPVVAEVVLVAELANGLGGLREGERLLIAERVAFQVLDVAVEHTVDVEQMQVVLEPAHRGLQHGM